MDSQMEILTKASGTSLQGSKLSPTSKIALALTAMAAHRRGEWDKTTLELTADRLSKENFEDVIDVIGLLGDSPRKSGEPSIPDTGTILALVRDISHPLGHLRSIVRKLCEIFGKECTETLLESYRQVAGHRTDADLDAAYRTILRDETLTRMPSTGRFLEACGVLREYRDGTRPE